MCRYERSEFGNTSCAIKYEDTTRVSNYVLCNEGILSFSINLNTRTLVSYEIYENPFRYCSQHTESHKICSSVHFLQCTRHSVIFFPPPLISRDAFPNFQISKLTNFRLFAYKIFSDKYIRTLHQTFNPFLSKYHNLFSQLF